MGKITSARAWANNEVAFIAWDIDGRIDGCLGFEITRVYLNEDGTPVRLASGEEDRAKLPSWVAFAGQGNPRWAYQDTGVWPVQKLSWRDLTLRKRRDSQKRRPDQVRVRYEIRPVGDLKPGLLPVPPNGRETLHVHKRDAAGKTVRDGNGKPVWEDVAAYEGAPRPLAYLGPAALTNDLLVTSRIGPFCSTFTNGILAAQWLSNVLNADGKVEKDELLKKLTDPVDGIRKYLAGDVLPLIRDLFQRPGEFYLALYELEDEELEGILVANAGRIHVILANTGESGGKWDKRNQAARQRLVDAGVDIEHRMFNNAIHIGHNKFVVHVPPAGSPRAVLTGSTNWTSTGLAGQTNNALLVEDDAVAGAYLDYWQRLKNDPLPLPKPLSKAMKDSQQGKPFRKSNETPVRVQMANGRSVEAWFSPNMQRRQKAGANSKSATPPDLAAIYKLIAHAREAVLFLAFYPAQRGVDCIIGEAIELGRMDRSLLVTGAVSSPQAMPNYRPMKKDRNGKVLDKGESPNTFDDGNISIVRAARIDEKTLCGDLGVEQLAAYGGVGAIIHDKIVVIDPRLPSCSVILGSHNLGFKASYSNDENLLIVSGDRDLAAAYAVHVLDVYDHYRFRAVEAELECEGKEGWSGFLEIDDTWQEEYFSGIKGALPRYFAK
ncbi:MAG: phospholipase D-like domain-containing protein [Acidobacteria bacterium]|nr:phospholipase D-like domain-containing protein [Acidobacteriota bacterium]